MKTKNQTGHAVSELAITTAANEDGFSAKAARETATARKQAWSPLEVWRTRVKNVAPLNHSEPV